MRERATIQAADSGIWVTCNKGKESQCIGELRDLFYEHAEALFGDTLIKFGPGPSTNTLEPPSVTGIENEIQDEIAEMQQPSSGQLFTPIRLDVPCGKLGSIQPHAADFANVQIVVFFKTIKPIEPVRFIKGICEDAMNQRNQKRTRFAKRFSPMTLMGRASEEGLEKVAQEVLRPHFHQEPLQRQKASDSLAKAWKCDRDVTLTNSLPYGRHSETIIH